MAAIHLTKESFKQLVYNYESSPDQWHFEGTRPAVVDFFATWCGPCKRLSPVLDALADEYAGRVDIYKLDVDQAEDIAAMFDVRSVPTLLFARPGGEPLTMSGVMPQNELAAQIDEKLLG